MNTISNLILATDFYKGTHHSQYPKHMVNGKLENEITHLYSYAEARTGGKFKTISWLGLQGVIVNHLLKPVTMKDVAEAEDMITNIGGFKENFNREVWEKVAELGYLPIKIKALPEGMEVPEGTPLFTMESTEEWFATTLNSLETVLMHVWYPTTIATNSLHIKKGIKPLFEQSSDSQDIESALAFAVNDFGMRGATSLESAAFGGMGHLLHFKGSDNMIADLLIKNVYNGSTRGSSVVASEHSVATSYGKGAGEFTYMNAMLDNYPDGAIVSVVIDSYDPENFVNTVVADPTIRQKIINKTGRVVLRPDSGVPKEQVLGILNRLERIFGATVNSKGYKTINHNIGVIQGDGMYLDSIVQLYQDVLDAGFSADNLVVGSGGGLLQQGFTRDTQRFAIKASYGVRNGEGFNIQKDPKSDPTKKSKTGRMKVVYDDNHELITVPITDTRDDLLQTVLHNGQTTFDTFDMIVERAKETFK